MIEQKVGTQGEGLGSVKKTSKIRMEKLFEQVKKCASNYPNIYKIVLFGSRARLMSNRLHIFHPKDSCDNSFIRLIGNCEMKKIWSSENSVVRARQNS